MAAELTRDGSNYTATVAALSGPWFSPAWLELGVLQHRAAAQAVVAFLAAAGEAAAPGDRGQAMVRSLDVALRAISLDAWRARRPRRCRGRARMVRRPCGRDPDDPAPAGRPRRAAGARGGRRGGAGDPRWARRARRPEEDAGGTTEPRPGMQRPMRVSSFMGDSSAAAVVGGPARRAGGSHRPATASTPPARNPKAGKGEGQRLGRGRNETTGMPGAKMSSVGLHRGRPTTARACRAGGERPGDRARDPCNRPSLTGLRPLRTCGPPATGRGGKPLGDPPRPDSVRPISPVPKPHVRMVRRTAR